MIVGAPYVVLLASTAGASVAAMAADGTADLSDWQGILKGLGAAGLLIVYQYLEGRRKDQRAEKAEANERAAQAMLIAAKDSFAKTLLDLAGKNTEMVAAQIEAANATANGMDAMGSGFQELAGVVKQIGERIPEKRRASP